METEERAAVHKPFIGVIHVNECPIQPHIPIYLIVIGGSGIILLMLAYWNNSLNEGVWKVRCLLCILCMVIFNIIWFLRGSVLIYLSPNYNLTIVSVPYCNKTLYLFDFWTTPLMYIVLAVVFMCSCCWLISLCVCEQDNESEEAPEA